MVVPALFARLPERREKIGRCLSRGSTVEETAWKHFLQVAKVVRRTFCPIETNLSHIMIFQKLQTLGCDASSKNLEESQGLDVVYRYHRTISQLLISG